MSTTLNSREVMVKKKFNRIGVFRCISGGGGSIILQKLASVRYWLAVDDTGRSEVDERNEERKLFGMLSHRG